MMDKKMSRVTISILL